MQLSCYQKLQEAAGNRKVAQAKLQAAEGKLNACTIEESDGGNE